MIIVSTQNSMRCESVGCRACYILSHHVDLEWRSIFFLVVRNDVLAFGTTPAPLILLCTGILDTSVFRK